MEHFIKTYVCTYACLCAAALFGFLPVLDAGVDALDAAFAAGVCLVLALGFECLETSI